jgi:hypothetical protein
MEDGASGAYCNVGICQSTRHHIPGGLNIHQYDYQNLKYHKFSPVLALQKNSKLRLDGGFVFPLPSVVHRILTRMLQNKVTRILKIYTEIVFRNVICDCFKSI